MKKSIVILLIMSLSLLPSCKKSPKEDSSADTEKTTAKTEANGIAGVESNNTEAANAMIPLPTKLPKPMFVGTPANIRVENLERKTGARPAVFVPAGTKNVALGKPVTSTDEEPIFGEIEMVTDGDKSAADGSHVELGPFLQNITIDLEAEYEIYAILLWHYHNQGRVYYDVIVQIANDPDFITNVRTLFNNDIDNSAGCGIGKDMHYIDNNEGKLVDAKGQKARYVRLYSSGNSNNELNHYIEVEVFGKPTK